MSRTTKTEEILNYLITNEIDKNSDFTWEQLAEEISSSIQQKVTADGIRKIYKNVYKNLKPKSLWTVKSKNGPMINRSFSFSEKDSLDTIWAERLKEIKNINIKVSKLPIDIKSNNFVKLLFLSDIHFGSFLKYNDYGLEHNLAISTEKFNKLQDKLLSNFKTFGKYKELHVFFLGDIFDGLSGKTVRDTVLESIESVEEIVDTFYNNIIGLILFCHRNNLAESIKVYSLTNSNHDPYGDLVGFKGVKRVLDFAAKDIDMVTTDNFLSHYIIGNKCYVVTHGKDKKYKKRGLPFNLNDNTENYLVSYCRFHKLMSYEIVVVKGDLHKFNSTDGLNLRYVNVSSMLGSSGYTLAEFGVNIPKCNYHILSNEDIIEGEYRLV